MILIDFVELKLKQSETIWDNLRQSETRANESREDDQQAKND